VALSNSCCNQQHSHPFKGGSLTRLASVRSASGQLCTSGTKAEVGWACGLFTSGCHTLCGVAPPVLWCRKVTSGMDVLHKLESLETRKEGIFVMPKEVSYT